MLKYLITMGSFNFLYLIYRSYDNIIHTVNTYMCFFKKKAFKNTFKPFVPDVA